ncbi:hypothetical protein Cfor_12293, partial [Coptotermes formosanus]
VPFSNTAVSPFALGTGADDYCDSSTPKCYNCTFAPLCQGSYSLGPYNCAELYPNKPYCTDGVCSNTPNTTCPNQTQKSFVCTGNGSFPDPNDCQKFHVCDASQNQTTYTCSSNYVYSHAKKSCDRKKVTADCAVIKCRNTTAIEYVVYPKDANIYGLCIRGKATVFSCGERQEFDTSTSTCKFVCKQEGVFPRDNCRKYYECLFVTTNRYNYLEWECPAGTRFDDKMQACVEGTCP